ncbi:Gustatory receptor for sugar taste 64f [Folsomia candida]|uniref:Gustatory receptor for sugar taste 64f n=1 Tax=Folsomia candida TaxID=158441 RepID=A0A226DD32_FOLCA|nr:Gustatory receptor for sugar taste 64f [Folsomia candida]
MKSSNFMLVQTISPISLLQHHNHNNNNNTRESDAQKGTTPSRNGGVEIGVDHFLGNRAPTGVRSDDLYKCIRTLLIFGRKWSISGIISFSIILILCCNTGLAIVGFFQGGGRDATQLAKNLAGSVCYSMGLYVFIFIFRNAQKLIDLFHKWREVDAMQNHASDASLHLSINTIAGTILISAIAENAVSHLLLFPLHERVPQPLQYYYENSHKQWSLMIPYHATAAIGVFLCNKWAVYAWNFGDIFIAVISRGLYGKFKRFVESVEEKLLKSPSPAGT